MPPIVVGVVGNPNCGKTTLFNALTGGHQRVGNWPGVTVEKKVGRVAADGTTLEIVDLPGIYSLSPYSLDGRIARDFVIHEHPDVLINIVDATNLERHLYLTAQLLELRVPLVLALNMVDLLPDYKLRIDTARLTELLGCPVVPVVARTGQGTEDLLRAVRLQAAEKHVSPVAVAYPREVERLLARLTPALESAARDHGIPPRWLALKLLEDDEHARDMAGHLVDGLLAPGKARIEAVLGDETDIILADARYGFVHGVVKQVVTRTGLVRRHISDAIDRVVLNRILGVPIFLLAMYAMFVLSINVGQAFVDLFDGLGGTVLVDGLRALLEAVGAPAWLPVVLADGVGGGIRTVATFIPPIGLLFVCLAVLEDSGYMARAAFVMDRLMRVVGLPGKAFVPMLVGFGCNVPAILATRTLDRPRDRLLTIAMIPFMTCGARLSIYALFAVAFFSTASASLVFGLYVTGIVLAILTGLLMKGTLLRGDTATFVMELPPYHVPTVRGVLIHTWLRLRDFVLRAGTVILAVVLILVFLSSWKTDGTFAVGQSEQSVLAAVGRGIVPVFQPMGMTENNWPAAVGLFTGLLAKEAVVGTLSAMYATMGAAPEAAGQADTDRFDFWGGIGRALESVPRNLADLPARVLDPFGLMGVVEAPAEAALQAGAKAEDYALMAARFDGRVGAVAYLLFVLIYAPCVATMAAIYREAGLRWCLFVTVYLTVLAWVVSVGFYQAATFDRHPAGSTIWLVLLILAVASYALVLRHIGSRWARKTGGPVAGG